MTTKTYKPKAGELPKRCSKCTKWLLIHEITPRAGNELVWSTLQFMGHQHVSAGEDAVKEPAYTLEMRNCVCNSTLAIVVVEVIP